MPRALLATFTASEEQAGHRATVGATDAAARAGASAAGGRGGADP